MTPEVLITSALIFTARVVDVSLGTLRTMTIVRGRRRTAFVLGFLEVIIWVFAVARVIDNLQNPIVAVSYAAGFATGSVVGMTLERYLSMGQRVVRIFSARGSEIAAEAHQAGLKFTQFRGEGPSGPTTLLYIEARGRQTDEVLRIIRRIDPACFYMVEEVRASSTPLGTNVPRTGWLATIKRK